ncbi:MAG TPA: PhoX family phosphatase, partial [Acidimicrobiia bacterium]|nr:PhoX family phosphatase [Acidimicrobiia bacterium]
AAHGVSIVAVAFAEGQWRAVDSPFNRRITGTTPVTFSGPVPADHPALQANNPPMGTLNNCASGHTPWGTYLACEENFDGYFGTGSPITLTAPEQRYGLGASGGGYGWHTADPRFDLARNRNEPNRFGWVVEIDPRDARSTPVKRTALGRIKHESATVTEGRDGRIVVYTGDDQDGEYLYKFVGTKPWRQLRGQRQSPLDHGVLFVARFAETGQGAWIPLAHGQGALTAANGWADQADVLLRTRQAADAVGATKLDRPEWVAVHPKSGEVFVTLTNGTNGPTPVNPRKPNPYGQIVRLREAKGDNAAETFDWDIFVLAGDPLYDPLVKLEPSDIFGSPDGLAVDDDGRLWIQTDISNSAQRRADRGYDRIGNNQMLAADPATGEIRRFLTGPNGCEITGITFTPDHETMFVNVQHPGEATAAIGTPTPANPRAVSNWPDFDPAGRPRAATVAIRKEGGGRIGT